MSLEITYFVHGTTTDNEQHLSSGWNDVDISELGVQQSKDLPSLNETLFDAVFCSDLIRAIHSAELSFKGKFPIIVDERLRECNYGDYNGNPSEIVEPLQEMMVVERFPNGESYEDVKQRIELFLHDLKASHDGKRIAIVAHKAPQLALDLLLKGMTWEEAFAADWRKLHKWQPGWGYTLN